MKQNKYLCNMVDYARSLYIKAYELAVENEFCSIEKLNKLDDKVLRDYTKLQNRPKKLVISLLSAASVVYNNEIIVNGILHGELTAMIYIVNKKYFTIERFRKFWQDDGTLKFLKMGIPFKSISNLEKRLTGGIVC